MTQRSRELPSQASPGQHRPPGPLLAPYVSALWTVERPTPRPYTREATLPTAAAHVVFRLGSTPVRLFASSEDEQGKPYGQAVVCGVRSRPYLRDVTWPTVSVGATLRAGALPALFGVPGHELAERHVQLEAVWGQAAASTLARLEEAASPALRLDLLESALLARLSPLRAMHPAVAHALTRLGAAAPIARIVDESGYSHRHFVALFRESVGLLPKQFARVLRFREALTLVAAGRSLAEVAERAGYADQAHFAREFREHAGLSPRAYLALGASPVAHLPVQAAQARSISFKTARRARGMV